MSLGATHGPTSLLFVKFGAMDGSKTYKFIWFRIAGGPGPYEGVRFGAMDGQKHYKITNIEINHSPKRMAPNQSIAETAFH